MIVVVYIDYSTLKYLGYQILDSFKIKEGDLTPVFGKVVDSYELKEFNEYDALFYLVKVRDVERGINYEIY